MTDRLELDLDSNPPTYRGNHLLHRLAVPAAEFEPVVEQQARTTHGRGLGELSPVEIDEVRRAVETDTQPWAQTSQYHVANCPGCADRTSGA